MSTPVGHSLAAAAILLPLRQGASIRLWLFAVFAANAPDLDLLAGLPFHDPNRFHQGVSHSLGFALLFGLTVLVFSRSTTPALLGTLCYGSHLLLDLFTFDGRPPYGIPLLWPLSGEYLHAPFDLFQGVRHGVPGDGPLETLRQILSWHNVRTLLIELAILLPVTLASLVLTRRRARSTP